MEPFALQSRKSWWTLKRVSLGQVVCDHRLVSKQGISALRAVLCVKQRSFRSLGVVDQTDVFTYEKLFASWQQFQNRAVFRPETSDHRRQGLAHKDRQVNAGQRAQPQARNRSLLLFARKRLFVNMLEAGFVRFRNLPP